MVKHLKKSQLRLLLLPILSLLSFSCSKISQSELQGNWYVNTILVKEVTSDTDSGWISQECIAPVFVVHEILMLQKSVILPCPSADFMLRGYNDYKGEIKYSLSGDKLVIPEIHYSQYKVEENSDASASEITFYGITFNVNTNGGNMDLSSTVEQTDNLGNVKKRTNVRIELSKTELTNEDK